MDEQGTGTFWFQSYLNFSFFKKWSSISPIPSPRAKGGCFGKLAGLFERGLPAEVPVYGSCGIVYSFILRRDGSCGMAITCASLLPAVPVMLPVKPGIYDRATV